MNIAIDFDETVHDSRHPIEGRRMGPPIAGAKEALEGLKRKGHRLIIHSVRGGSPKHIEDWMKYYGIPYHEVTNIKPNDIAFFIDDHGLRFEGDWTATIAEMERLDAVYQANKRV